MMRKSYGAFLALAMMLTILTGCTDNVSHREDGKITQPTSSAATMPTVATMPSTDTAPIDTMPMDTLTTDPSDGTQPSETGSQEGRPRHAHPRDPMARN